MKKSELLRILLGLPKTVFINFKYLKFKDALKLPIIVSYRTKYLKLSGLIKIKCPIKCGMIRIGLEGSGTLSCMPTILQLNGTIICNGYLNIGGGSEIVTVNKNSMIIFGNHVNLTGGVKLISRKSITIDDNSIVSWNTQIMDTDFHKIYQDNKITNEDKEIIIGKNVWIGSRCNILKGCRIEDDNVIASGSNIYSKCEGHNQVITGTPIKVLKSNITWKL